MTYGHELTLVMLHRFDKRQNERGFVFAITSEDRESSQVHIRTLAVVEMINHVDVVSVSVSDPKDVFLILLS